MKLVIVALCLAAATAASAAPVPENVAKAFGNTVVSTYPDGRTALLWLSPDGTYAAKGRHRTSSNGLWAIKGEKMCLRQRSPLALPFSFCTPLPSSTSWAAKAATGEPVTLRIVPGTNVP